ncbi:MAG: S49 family peptidase [Candidatus Dactylopiibacterium sp.]|nr:S49 family peptidase [Candidatus Dactylopiibacterium sp.]
MTEENGRPGWERSTIEKLAFESLREARRRRRWSIFFRLAALVYVGALIWMFWSNTDTERSVSSVEHIALVRLDGTIAVGERASAENLIASLREAFEASAAKGVILAINSPGGSPVQAGQINDEIRRLRAAHPDKPLYAVVGDICASGGYYVAAAADRIFVDKASIVGSIGVRMDSFGFTGAMEKAGIERRSITAGENKAFLDPFMPQNPQQVAYAREMLDEVHRQFIDVVRKGRGERLKETPEMFSGLVWSGARSVELGLADGTGSVGSVAREVFKIERVRDYSRSENVAERLAKRFGASFGGGVLEAFERLGWN